MTFSTGNYTWHLRYQYDDPKLVTEWAMDRTVDVPDQQARSRLRLVLAVLCAADFLVVLDGLVVAVALPAMQQAPGHFGRISAMGDHCLRAVLRRILLLAGRIGDLYGRRRVLVVGLMLFAAGSLLAGLAWTPLTLFGGRALQGLGAAAMTPTALALLTVAFTDPAARARAFGVWSAVSSAGIPAGALLGGVLTATAGWRWVLLVNVPAALVAAAVTRAVVDESAAAERPPGLDWVGAVLVTAGLAAVIAGFTQAEHAHTAGALLGRVVTPVVLGLMLLSAFVVVERRTSAPLVPLDQLRAPGLLSVNLVGLVLPVGLGTGLFLGTLYLQLVVGLTPLYTGLAYLALALPCIIASPLASRLTLRLGRRATATAGLLLQAAGLLLLARVTATTGNLANVPGALSSSGSAHPRPSCPQQRQPWTAQTATPASRRACSTPASNSAMPWPWQPSQLSPPPGRVTPPAHQHPTRPLVTPRDSCWPPVSPSAP